jgi:hypothetical protein
MARIKFTVPASAVQIQSARVLHDQNNGASIKGKTQTEVKNSAKSTVSEGLLLKQQQSLEMVQIMLHVSVSILKSDILCGIHHLKLTLSDSLGHYFIFGA